VGGRDSGERVSETREERSNKRKRERARKREGRNLVGPPSFNGERMKEGPRAPSGRHNAS